MPAWLLLVVKHWGFKVFGGVLVIALIGGSFYFTYRSGYKTGYSKSLQDNPRNVFNAPATINQQPCPTPSVYGISLGKWGLGLIHKK